MKTSHPNRFPRRRTAGSVVLLVLVTVLLAAFMLTKFVQRATTELLADARAGDQARLRREAYSALEVTLAVLADVRTIDQGLFSPAQGWAEPLAYAGYKPQGGITVEVGFEDESGRISLPRADAATLESLFVQCGVDRNQAERASDALLVWMHADYVPPTLEADPGNYERGALPHRAARRPLRSPGELASVAVVRDLLFDDDGTPNARYSQFVGAISLQAFERVNLNAASPVALATLGLAPGQIGALRDYLHPAGKLSGRTYFQGIDEASAALGAGTTLDRFTVQIQVLRVNVTVHDGSRLYRLSAVVAPPGGASAPRSVRPPSATGATTDVPAEQKSPVTIKKLDYPFKVLELLEDVESVRASAEDIPDPHA